MEGITPEMAKSANFMASEWGNSETETIAANIVFVCGRINSKSWQSFSWEQYRRYCTHRVTLAEKWVLDTLVCGGRPTPGSSAYLFPGYLEFDGEKYSVTERFLSVVKEALQ
jgi:hypothetical protein